MRSGENGWRNGFRESPPRAGFSQRHSYYRCFFLACVRLKREGPIALRDPDRSRFGIVALLLAIFADEAPEVAGHFCPQSAHQLLPDGWDQHYF
jgi:hypothetical protein